MECATVGDLRAYLDGELPAERMESLARHLASCVSCEKELEQLRANATIVREALDIAAPAPLELPVSAWGRVRDRIDRRANRPVTHGSGVFEMVRSLFGRATTGRLRLATAGITVAVAVAVLFALPPVQTAASSFLSVFRVNKFVAVTVDPGSLPDVPAPSDLGSLKVVGDHSMKQVTLAQAESTAGFKMRLPSSLPSGIEANPKGTLVSGSSTYTFTPDLKKVRAYLASIGASNVQLPDKLDGAPISVQIQPGIAVLYAEGGGIEKGPDGLPKPHPGQKFLYVGATSSPSITVPDGVDVNQVRSELLKVPGLPSDLVNQIKAVDDWTNTVMVPVVKGSSKNVTVQGVQGVLVSENGGPGRTLLWQKDGVVYVMTSSAAESELLAAANSMK